MLALLGDPWSVYYRQLLCLCQYYTELCGLVCFTAPMCDFVILPTSTLFHHLLSTFVPYFSSSKNNVNLALVLWCIIQCLPELLKRVHAKFAIHLSISHSRTVCIGLITLQSLSPWLSRHSYMYVQVMKYKDYRTFIRGVPNHFLQYEHSITVCSLN